MKKILTLLLLTLTIVSCSDDDETSTQSISINTKAVAVYGNITSGKYYIKYQMAKDSIDSNIERGIYFPFPDEKESYACDLSYSKEYYTNENCMRMMDNSTEIVFNPLTGASFNITTGDPVNDKAKGLKLKIYKVTLDTKSGFYYLKAVQ